MDEKPKKTATSPTGKFAIYDTVDHCWLGNDKGPVRYDELDFARMAAAIATEQLGWQRGRLRAADYADEPVTLLDVIDCKCGAAEALRRLEPE